ncbi:MAG: protein-disulfide reductase DsbD [Gammaproteobacteria bacterium]
MLNTITTRLFSLFLICLLPLSVLANDEPLMPDEAFKVSARADGPDAVLVEWDIAKGYYLYRDKFNFVSNTDGISTGAVELPKGKMKYGVRPDGTEGDVEVFMDKLSVRVPISRSSAATQLELTAHSQGCAEIGICYPPHRQQLSIELPAATSGGALQTLSTLSQSLGFANEDEVLPPEQAFAFSHEVIDGNTVVLRWQIAKDHYLYQDKFNFKLTDVSGVRLGEVKFSEAESKFDPIFDKTLLVYHDAAEATVDFVRSNPAAMNVPLQVVYQGCAEKMGLCYPPQTITVDLLLPASSATVADLGTAPAAAATEFVSEQDQSAQVLASGEYLKIIIYFFLGGLALAFTACMYPMIPILSSIIVGQGDKVTTAGAFGISMVYVQSMAVTFGIMGALVAMFAGGINLQAYFQSPWILIPFSMLFILLAFSMFGFYTIQMPASLQGKLSEISNKQSGGSFIGVAIMGALSALIIGPCAGPVVIGALAVAAKDGDIVLGFLSMFVLGNGLGLPLLVVGTTGGKFMPKAGTWMDVVKAVAGVILLSIALLFLERVSFIPAKAIMLLWATLFIVSGIYMGALEQLQKEASGWMRLWKGLGIVLMLYGVLVMLGGLTGARNFNDPLHGSSLVSSGGGAVAQEQLNFKKIKTKDDLQRELAAASAAGKHVMLDFYADWCTYCKQFEDYVFSDGKVQALLKDFVLLKADVTANDAEDQALNKHTQVQAPPAILFHDKNGVEIRKFRVVGAMDAEAFAKRIQQVIDSTQ